MTDSAPVIRWDGQTAVYQAADAEFTIDMGIYIDCPDCGKSVMVDRALVNGCWEHGCGRDVWQVLFEQSEVSGDE